MAPKAPRPNSLDRSYAPAAPQNSCAVRQGRVSPRRKRSLPIAASLAWLAVFALAAPLPAHADAAPALALGEPAPPLHVAEWICGGPVDLAKLAGHSPCVIDLWRSRCPACLWLTPERSELQASLAEEGVVFVTITDEAAETVLDAIGPAETLPLWHIARDDAGRTFTAYLSASDMRVIPFSVVIDRAGKVAWFGPKDAAFEDIVRAVAAGTWDVDAERSRREQEKRFSQLQQTMVNCEMAGTCECETALAVGRELLAMELDAEHRRYRASTLGGVVRTLVGTEACAEEHGAEALQMAERMVEDLDEPRAFHLAAYARALFAMGETKAAVQQQQAALRLPASEDYHKELAETLRTYAEAHAAKTGETIELPEEPAAAPKPDAAASPEGDAAKDAPPAPGGPLTAAEAIADLTALHEMLMLYYVGYDDVAWQLRRKGASWAARTESFRLRLAERETWQPAELFDLFHEYVQVINDAHFAIGLKDAQSGKLLKHGRAWRPHDPYFAQLRVARKGNRFVVSKAPKDAEKLVGLELRAIPVISATDTATGVARLFPTVPSRAGQETFLLGAMAPEPVADLPITLYTKRGVAVPVVLPLHRGGALNPKTREKGTPPWELVEPPAAAWPTLRVRTCDSADMATPYEATGTKLHDAPIVVLDLRGNVGGADAVAHKWLRRFSPQVYHGYANTWLGSGVPDRFRRLNSCVLASPRDLRGDAKQSSAHSAYAGRLFVVTDRNVASSGETFTAMVRQIPGSVLLGENTMGCMTYGNAGIRKALPHSDIRLRFGYTKYLVNDLTPFREGLGFLPDYWLDDVEPETAVRRLLEDASPRESSAAG